MKKLGYLSSASDDQAFKPHKDAFIAGLQQAGYTPGQNVDIAWKFAGGDYPKLQTLANELVQAQVDVIATVGGAVSAWYAVEATHTIPVTFISGYDAKKLDILKYGNATGVNLATTESEKDRLGHLKQLAGDNRTYAVLLRQGTAVYEQEVIVAQQAGLVAVSVSGNPSRNEIQGAFNNAQQQGANGIIVCADPSFTSQYKTIVQLEKQFNWPAGYSWRQYPEDGGLMSFGPILSQAFTTVGIYSGRILTSGDPGGSGTPIVTLDPKKDYVLVVNKARADHFGFSIPASWTGQVVIV